MRQTSASFRLLSVVQSLHRDYCFPRTTYLGALDQLGQLRFVFQQFFKGCRLDKLFKGGRVQGGHARRWSGDGFRGGLFLLNLSSRNGTLDFVQNKETRVSTQNGNRDCLK